jgi:hypothetical protein
VLKTFNIRNIVVFYALILQNVLSPNVFEFVAYFYLLFPDVCFACDSVLTFRVISVQVVFQNNNFWIRKD